MAGKMASRKKKEKAFNVLAFFIVLILAALVLLPIWWIFRSSLMSTAALNEYPPSFICLCKTSFPREKADLQHLCWHDSSSGNGNLDSSVYFLDKGNGTG